MTNAQSTHFIRQIIDDDRSAGKNGGRVATRFPPEPNGYLHMGHAKSICLNFGLARDYAGICNLRFDDTNPAKEDVEYVDAIQDDVKWLGFQWSGLYYAADYFPQMYDYAEKLIQSGKAYVCELNADQIRQSRGTLTEVGKNSPFRDRPASESLDLFRRMKAGEFPDGSRTLRAKIDMASPNINMRDPVIYRIKRAHHHRTGDQWCIYPMYDYAHPIEDMIEGITHSICTLEFEDHRPFYDWVLDNIGGSCHPQQIEFARGNLNYTIMSKRYLLELVQKGKVSGWDDPRMPTIQGIRRRGFTPESIRTFWENAGVTKKNTTIDFGVLEGCIRDDLDARAPRAMVVVHPLRVVIENYPDGQVEEVDVPNHPRKPEMGTRKVKFSKVLFIEQSDFMENPPKDFFRLAPGREVRLRSAYFVKCNEVIKDPKTGQIVELRCTYDPATRGGNSPDGRKVKGTLHWVSEGGSFPVEIRLYDRLFNVPSPGEGGVDYLTQLNPSSLEVLQDSRAETSLADAVPEGRFQFERIGYFCADRRDSRPGKPVFNRTVTLKDSWSKDSKA